MVEWSAEAVISFKGGYASPACHILAFWEWKIFALSPLLGNSRSITLLIAVLSAVSPH